MTVLRNRATQFFRADGFWIVGLGLVLTLIVVLSQNRVVGWEPGYNELQPGHHGWVSSHTLAVIAHATPANGFVGYALRSIDEDGRLDFDYFDRYPVYFSAAMHALLSLKPRLSTQVFLAKEAMNGIFLLTVGAAFLLLRKLSLPPLHAAAAVILAVSSPYLLFYKDMVHYDQPALLGLALLILTIAWCKIDGKRSAFVYGAVLLATSMGRGYASLTVLGLWFVLEAIEVLARREMPLRSRLASVARLTALRALLLGTAWAALNLAYNIQVEAGMRGIGAMETSIVRSAVNRLSLNEDFNASYAGLLGWRYFVSDELIRLVRWSFPVWNYEGSALLSAGVVAVMAVTIVLFGRRLDPARRQVLILLTLAGPIWLFAMRNLSAFHDYTAMYFLGIPLAFYGSVMSLIRLPRLGWIVAVALALTMFVARNAQIQNLHREIGADYSVYTHDFMRIADVLPSPESSVHLANGVPYAPYAAGFYLPNASLAPVDVADFAISRNRRFGEENLTPENSRLFLFRINP